MTSFSTYSTSSQPKTVMIAATVLMHGLNTYSIFDTLYPVAADAK